MGAGQIGGIASLLEIDFENAAGFVGTPAENWEAQYVVHFFSQALIFCMGSLIEPHVILTPAACVDGEKSRFNVYSGTHIFLEHAGIERMAEHVCLHRGYNRTNWRQCSTANIALIVVDKPFSFSTREGTADYVLNRIRYGYKPEPPSKGDMHCQYYGWGSRRNGYLVPLLIHMHRVEVTLLPSERCSQIWNYDSSFLCLLQNPCKSEKFGSLCPDDMGSIIECDGFAVGMMISHLIDRPCGVGFVNLTNFHKFLMCGVDDAREVIGHDSFMSFDFSSSLKTPATRHLVTVPDETSSENEERTLNKNKMVW